VKEIENQKRAIIQMRDFNHSQHIRSEQMIKSSKALTDFVIVSEDLRKKFSDNLRVALSERDNDKNTIFDL